MKLLFASTNGGKLKEMQEIAAPFGMEVISPNDLDTSLGPVPIVQEGIISYHSNARIKAVAYYSFAKMPTIADDAGLEVKALNWAPGVSSARFAGIGATDHDNIEKLLKNLDGITDRKARFRSVLCYIAPDGLCVTAEGTLDGVITTQPNGAAGFGYDPIFEVAGFGETLAKLKETFRPRTHRAIAFENLIEQLKCYSTLGA